MTSPQRRIWLYPACEALEIMMFGSLTDIGQVFAIVRSGARAWRGFDQVNIIAAGTTVAGLGMSLSRQARSLDPVAEGLEMIDGMRMRGGLPRGFAWRSAWNDGDNPAGIIGTW